MRSLTGQDNAVLNAQDGHSAAARVWVWDGAAWVDVTSLEGRDWLVEVAWDEGVNEPCAQASVTLRRQLEDLSLNPLVLSKLTGTLALGRAFYIQAATVPLGDAPQSGDWREVFRGQVETLSLDKDPLTFTGRDNAGALLRAYIETETEYGSDSGVAVETVIQSILTDNSTGVTLYVPVATGAVFGRFKQKRAPVLTAIRELALRIGWDVRYRWDDGTSSFRFTLLKPDRLGAVGAVWSFPPSKVKRVTRLEQTVFDVRNAIRVFYYNRAVLNSAKQPTLSSVTAEDATSISTYGRNYMQLAEPEDSPIDSAAEAQVMANAARDDLKDPLLDFGCTVGFHYGIQLGDLLTFEWDDIHFSADQTLAVVSAAHSIGVRGHSTSLSLRGKPVGANAAWLRQDARIRPQPPATQPDAVGGLTATPTVNGATIRYTAPAVFPVPAEYELHLSPTSGFTPDTSSTSTTFEAVSASDTFTVTDMSPGVTRYAKVLPKSSTGVYGAASAEVSFTTLPVQPRHMQEKINFSALPPNGDFEAQNDPAAPPDKWGMSMGTWGTSAQISTTSFTGGKALYIPATASAVFLLSEFFVVRPNERLFADSVFMIDVSGAAGGTGMGASINYYADPNGSILSSQAFSGPTSATAANTWSSNGTVLTVDPSARYAQVAVGGSASGGNTWIDSVRVVQASMEQEGYFEVSALGFSNSWSNWGNGIEGVGFRLNSLGDVQLKGLAKSPTPAPAAYASIFTLPSGYRPSNTRLWRIVASDGVATDVEVKNDGTVAAASIGAGLYLSLEGLTFTPA